MDRAFVHDNMAGRRKAIGQLIAGAINLLLSTEEPDPEMPDLVGCCRIHCGPCAALHWFYTDGRGYADTCVNAAYPEMGWSWTDAGGAIDWPQLTALWDAHPGCSSTAGVWHKCEKEED